MIDDKEAEAQAWRTVGRLLCKTGLKETEAEKKRRFMFEVLGAMKYICQQSCAKCMREEAQRTQHKPKAERGIGLGE
jgi:hypothetical protein